MTVVRRWLAVAATACVVLLPTPAHAACTTPELPVVGCVVPGAAASATPMPEQPTPSPTASVPSPVPTPTQQHDQAPVVAVPAPGSGVLGPVPSLAPAPGPAPVLIAAPPPVVTRPRPVAQETTTTSSVSGVVASSFALVAFGLLGIPLLLAFLAGLRPAPASPSYGGTVNTHRTRLWTGLGVLAAAAVVGGVGWYRVSGEPLLNRQIPFLASAGIVVVLLSVLGGSLIIAEQLRGDQNRISELENAVRALTDALSPMVELPPRKTEDVLVSGSNGRGRSRSADAGRA